MVDFGQQHEIINIKCDDDTRPIAAIDFCVREFADRAKNITYFDEKPYIEVHYTL